MLDFEDTVTEEIIEEINLLIDLNSIYDACIEVGLEVREFDPTVQ